MKPELEGTWLVPGEIDGEIVCLDEPLSFWGGFDPITGRIIDRSHPQHGLCLTDRVVAMQGSKGSSGTPGVLGESIRRATGPRAFILTKPDINLIAGALTAEALYGRRCPILLISQSRFEDLKEQAHET
jgi:predicted aconitase with swiveling domain